MLVALKLNHRIYDVLQNLWSGKRSLLINMSYQNNRNATRLGKTEQGGCTLTNLGNRTRRTVYFFRSNSLDRIYNYQLRSHFLNMAEDFLQLRFAENRNMIEGSF